MTGPAATPSRARLHFHIALALLFVPCIGVLVTVGLAIYNSRTPGASAEHARWTRRLGLLALIDGAILLLLVVIGQMMRDPTPLPAATSSVRIGIGFDRDDPSAEPRVAAVHPGWAAERAGLRPGDLVLAVDGASVATQSDLRRSIGAKDWGIRRVLTVRREEAVLEIAVIPERPRDPRELGLFEAVPGPIEWRRLLHPPWHWGAILLIMGVSWFRGRRSPLGGIRVWLGFLLIMGLETGLALAAWTLVHHLQGGGSKGAVLVAMGGQGAGLLVGAAIASRWIPKQALSPEAPPPLAWWKTSLLGFFYFITGMARLGVVLFVVDRLFLGGTGLGATNPVRDLALSGLGTAGTLLFLADVVLMGPIAEEAAFRGYLLPRLRDRLGIGWAVAVSAMIFALLHHPYRLHMIFVLYMGLLLCWARLRSRGMDAPIVLHVAFNAVASLQILLGAP